MSFKNYTHCLKVPFTVYADFESLIVPLQSCSPGNDVLTTVRDVGDFYSVDSNGIRQKISSPPVSSTSYEAMHIPSGFSYAIVDHSHRHWREAKVYRGEDVVDTFFSWLIERRRGYDESYKS